jgi:Fe-S oxidoreductase
MLCILNGLGIATERGFPLLAKQRFSTWYKNYDKVSREQKVVLFIDTFTEFHTPEVGIAATKVLTALGYEVIVFSQECCGRPLISKGLLSQAKKRAEKLVKGLAPFAQQKTSIIGLEPSCILTIKDDFQGLLGVEHSTLKAISQVTLTLDEFLASHIKNGFLPLVFNQKNQNILVHGHCHQKALIGTEPTLATLRALPDAVVAEIPSGCCGVAGSFGYEREHYDLSMKIGELRLLPAIRKSSTNTLIVANGFSCRHQISHGTKRHSLHLAEVIAQAL